MEGLGRFFLPIKSMRVIEICRQEPFQNGLTIPRYRVVEKLGAAESELVVLVRIGRA